MHANVARSGWIAIALASGLLVALVWLPPAAAAPVAHFSRPVVTFGMVSQGVASPVQPVFVTNTGDATLSITGVSLTGTQAADFLFSGTCGPPVSLEPNERCRLDVVMKPLTARGQPTAAMIIVQSNAAQPSALIAVSGTVDPALTGAIFVPTPEWLDFTVRPVGNASPPLTMAIFNATALTFSIDDFSLAGGDSGDFTLTSTCAVGQKLAGGQTCMATVTFTPQVAGPRSTELVTDLRYFNVDGIFRYSITGAGSTTQPVVVVEYYNMTLDHYFITWIGGEIAILDAGVTIKGWTRTGRTFNTYPVAQSGTTPVCRYYIPPAKGDSHFFGRGTVECDATGQKNPSFALEDPQFMQMFLPDLGNCPANTTPIYRVFSNRPDANHRYMTDRSVRDQMVAKGWLAEGDGPDLVVMCAPA